MDYRKMRGYEPYKFEARKELMNTLNSAYCEFYRSNKDPFYKLEQILKDLGKLDEIRNSSAVACLDGAYYSKLVFLEKLLILFPWNDESGVVLQSKKTKDFKKFELNEKEINQIEIVLKKIIEELENKTAAK